MGKATLAAVLVACIVLTAQAQNLFNEDFQVTWGPDHVVPSSNGQSVKMFLDKNSGANFKSTANFLYGGFSAQIELPGGDSAGVCTALFLSSDGQYHDELDYEFLGNTSGQPYMVQTNVFANGVGAREERIYLWFDPTSGYHTYSVVWNQKQVTFLIDNIPVRIHGNYADMPGTYPNQQAMSVYSSIFDASDWATRGGAVPIDYTKSPFNANYKTFGLDGCQVPAGSSLAACSASSNSWWSQPQYQSLSTGQVNQLRWVRQNYLKYSYCTDTSRNPTPPAECARNNP